jgi:hypothetical protein
VFRKCDNFRLNFWRLGKARGRLTRAPRGVGCLATVRTALGPALASYRHAEVPPAYSETVKHTIEVTISDESSRFHVSFHDKKHRQSVFWFRHVTPNCKYTSQKNQFDNAAYIFLLSFGSKFMIKESVHSWKCYLFYSVPVQMHDAPYGHLMHYYNCCVSIPHKSSNGT